MFDVMAYPYKARIWFFLVKDGRKTKAQIPKKWRAQVLEMLKAAGVEV